MPYLDTVFDILERHNSAPKLGLVGYGFSRRKYVLQNFDNSKAQSRRKTFEDEMRVGLADSTTGAVRYIVTQNNVIEGK
jgi:hypothetical protein